MEKGKVDDLKKRAASDIEKNEHLPIAQVFLKIISAQIEVKDEETKLIKQIQGTF